MTVARIIYPSKVTEWSKMAKKSAYQAAVLAKDLRVSQRQLRRYTHSIFGRSPQKWLNEQRLVHAAEMLKSTRTAKAVAFQLGFKQLSHFSREFKLHYGVSPTRFLVWSDGQPEVYKSRHLEKQGRAR
jgi:AraC-like DNA-binding protein